MKLLAPALAALSLVAALIFAWTVGMPSAPAVRSAAPAVQPAMPLIRATDYPGASPWVDTDYARIRLVSGAVQNDGKRWLGVQITLQPKWKTYWRNPGYSGVPPRFNWSNSTNLASAQVSWPAPEYLKDDYGIAYGYYDQVVFPVEITPEASGKDVEIKLAVDYAVCREICIPEFSELALVLPPADPVADKDRKALQNLVTGFVARVPESQSAASELKIESAKVELKSGKPVLAITAALGKSSKGAELFVEGPEEFFFLVPGKPKDLGDGRGLYVVAIDGAKTVEDLAGAKIGGTLVTADAATEYWWTVQ